MFSFGWKSLGCPQCNAMINKYEWLVHANTARDQSSKPTPVEALIIGSVVVAVSKTDDAWRSMHYKPEDERVLVVMGEGIAQTGRDLVPLAVAINALKAYEDQPGRWKITIRG